MPDNEPKPIGAVPVPINDDIIKSLREWVASWGDGPNWSDPTGLSIPMAKTTILALLDDRDSWKKRAGQHGCNLEEGDHECG